MKLELDVTAHGGDMNGALFSDDGLHRLRLWRVWDPALPVLVWCLLNPSVAGAERSDLTLAKCIGFAKRNGYGGVILVNLYTLIATDPFVLRQRLNRANVPDADEHIRWACTAPLLSKVAVGWGSKPWAHQRAMHVLNYIRILRRGQVLCLGTTRDGYPKHPSRIWYGVPLNEM